MHLADYEGVISILAVTSTVLQFLSGVLVCKQYIVNRSTAEASPLPFICGIISCSLWLLYGIFSYDNLIILVNTIGVLLMISYTAVFYIYTFKKSTLLKQVTCTVILVLCITCYSFSTEDYVLLFESLGFAACSFTLLTVAAPMSKLMYVIRVKSTECLPFPMILMSFFVSSLWFLYGLIKEDKFLIIPNCIGAMLAAAQLYLFVIYPSKTLSPTSSKQTTA